MDFLKCDTKGCLHVELVDQISANHIGKECPVCGSNLLTREDFDDFTSIIKAKAEEGFQGIFNVHEGVMTELPISIGYVPTNQPKE